MCTYEYANIQLKYVQYGLIDAIIFIEETNFTSSDL